MDELDLFSDKMSRQLSRQAPLADRMRPRDLSEFVGQEEVVGRGKVLRLAVEQDRIPSMILWGPPGSGKTTLARIIALKTKSHFEQISAVTSGVADLRRLISEARERLALYGTKSVLFIDEIHRFNKAQQDALLPHVENGTIVLIGATTENPYFGVNAALVSRTRVFRLRPLNDEEIRALIMRALHDQERGIGVERLDIDTDALEHIVMVANGDVRSALNALELAAGLAKAAEESSISIESATQAVQRRALGYDKDGDQHYDTVSAFIKSMRGSDPDAALYWMARMIYAGEDPRFIARRIVIAAAEDVGNADPMALQLAVSAAQGVELIGMPEGRILLAQATVYVACAPKSNASYLAVDSALKCVEEGPPAEIPVHLRDTSYRGAARFGHGKGYEYPHDFPGHYVKQQHLPVSLAGHQFYRPSEQGFEAEIKRLQDGRRNV